MQRDGVHKPRGFAHQHFHPLIIIRIRAAGDPVNPVVPVIAHIRLVLAVQVSVIFRTHIPSAAPVFIAHAKIFHSPGLFPAILRAQLSHRRYTVKGQVFHPFRHFLNRSAAHVAVDVWLTFQHGAQLHEFMGSKMVVLHRAAPVRVNHPFAAFARTDAILPVIFIGKTTARPAQYRHLNFLKRFHNIIADALGVRNRRVLPYPDPFINATS
ncbi:hypothetical protein D3C74_338080 [compost metagenome]